MWKGTIISLTSVSEHKFKRWLLKYDLRKGGQPSKTGIVPSNFFIFVYLLVQSEIFGVIHITDRFVLSPEVL